MLTKEDLLQIAHIFRPLATRISNTVSRAVVSLVSDNKKMQLVQFGALLGQTVEGANPEGAEHFQEYGFTSVPLAGAEGIALFPNGDGEHPLLFAVSDRRYRPTGGQPGEVTVYNNTGAKITITKDGDVVAQPAPGRHVMVDDGAGGLEPVVKQSEFLSHGHPTAGTGAVSPPMVAPTSTPAATFPGTTLFQTK